MTAYPVQADSPSARDDSFVIVELADTTLSWRPERGWACAVHWQQPCIHTAALTPIKNPEWNQ